MGQRVFRSEARKGQGRMLHPDKPLRVGWDVLMLLLLLYVAVLVRGALLHTLSSLTRSSLRPFKCP